MIPIVMAGSEIKKKKKRLAKEWTIIYPGGVCIFYIIRGLSRISGGGGVSMIGHLFF